MADLKTHYAQRIWRSVHHLGETVWQPICGMGNTSNIKMSTVFEEVTCLNCQNHLIANRRKLGIMRQVNRMRREGKWRT